MASDAPKPAAKPTTAPAAVTPARPTVASKVTAPIAPKPTVKAVKVAPVAAAKVGEGETPPTPAGAGSVAAPAKVEESVRQPDGGVSPKQKLETPAQPKSQDSTKPAADFELPAAVYSPQLLESVIYDIEHYLEWYRQTQVQKRVGAKPSEEPTHSAETVLVIESWLDGKPATLETLEDLIATLRGLKLAQVHIMLAALPNRSQRETLVNWFRTNVSPHLLLSFVADRNLGGGAVIRTPNRVFDYTWKQQLIAGRGKLAEILKRV